jgi:hypothetical protein
MMIDEGAKYEDGENDSATNDDVLQAAAAFCRLHDFE